jgi:hypothetical protein
MTPSTCWAAEAFHAYDRMLAAGMTVDEIEAVVMAAGRERRKAS